MNEWTEQEEQQIIERAKTGDPEANYALSLWALHRGEEEPDEPRWNRLAAKCLVKAAQAGYGPAKEQMAALLGGQTAAPARQSDPPAKPQPRKQAPVEDEDEDEDAVAGIRRSAPVRRSSTASRNTSAPRPTASARRPAPRRQAPQDDADEGFDVDQASWDDDDDDARPVRKGRGRGPAPAARDSARGSGGRWGDDKWRRLETICVFVCAALLVIIAVMLISGKRGGGSSGGGTSIPPAGEVGAAGSGNVVSDYPDEATKNAIMAADLDIFPAPEDYETQPSTGTVSVSSEYLRVRKGPNTTYDPIAQLPNEASVSILAKKNDWDLIFYQGGEGPVYGWCSSKYLILTANAGAAATNAPGDVVG